MTLLLSLVDTHVGIFLTKKIFFRICPMIELLSCLLTLLKKKSFTSSVSPFFITDDIWVGVCTTN